jgi:hypothetical protein
MSTIRAAETVIYFAVGREGDYYETYHLWALASPWRWTCIMVRDGRVMS